MPHHLRLVSFKLCPFVQRSVIVLKHLAVPFEIEYIDLMNPPDWFKALSPLGKVPIVQVDHQHVIFESAVIMELVSELNPPVLHPHNPMDKAHNRAWIEYGSGLLGTQYELLVAPTPEAFRQALQQLMDQLARVETQLQATPFFNGPELHLIDAAYAPLFMRLALLEPLLPEPIFAATPKVQQWSAHLLSLTVVQQSVVPEFAELFFKMLKSRQGYLGTLITV